jgi:putative addiction module killer protein
MIEVVEYLDRLGRSPFAEWFGRLDGGAAAIVTVALSRLADGNTSNVAAIREGAAEVKIDRGPGYRIYFGWDGRTLVVLLGGGTKRRQQRDLTAALAAWRDYKERKPAGRPGRPWKG